MGGGEDLLGLPARFAVGNEPLQRDVDVVLLFAGDRVAANLPILAIKVRIRIYFLVSVVLIPS